MRRKRSPWSRRLFHVAAAVSLVLGLVIALLWTRSYWWIDQIIYIQPRAGGEEFTYALTSERPEVQFQDVHSRPLETKDPNPFGPLDAKDSDTDRPLRPGGFFAKAVFLDDWYAKVPMGLRPQSRLGAFRARQVREGVVTLHGVDTPSGTVRRWQTHGSVTVPYWALLAPAAVLPLAAGARTLRRRWRAQKWRRAGHCPACGYDLRIA